MRRVLLVNMEEAPENLHLEMAFVRAAAGLAGVELDVVHSFRYEYDFIPRVVNAKGFRMSAGAFARSGGAGRGYDAAVFLDVPKRRKPLVPWLAVLARGAFARRALVCNHLLDQPFPAESGAAMRLFDLAFLLRHDDAAALAPFFREGALRSHDYALDCAYYSPDGDGPDEGYVFSAGTTYRDYALLCEALAETGLKARIFADGEDADALAEREGVVFFAFSRNLDRIKPSIARARLVAVPIRSEAVNPCAGLTVTLMGMAMGKPVVTRDTPGMRRYIRSGVNGMLYEGGSAQSLAGCLKEACGRAGMGELSRRAALSLADMDRFAVDVLREVLSLA
ncbi:MAG: glycosyltransferase [Elusimicrobiota bacterium]